MPNPHNARNAEPRCRTNMTAGRCVPAVITKHGKSSELKTRNGSPRGTRRMSLGFESSLYTIFEWIE
jgi:hypothetical protein